MIELPFLLYIIIGIAITYILGLHITVYYVITYYYYQSGANTNK